MILKYFVKNYNKIYLYNTYSFFYKYFFVFFCNNCFLENFIHWRFARETWNSQAKLRGRGHYLRRIAQRHSWYSAINRNFSPYAREVFFFARRPSHISIAYKIMHKMEVTLLCYCSLPSTRYSTWIFPFDTHYLWSKILRI